MMKVAHRGSPVIALLLLASVGAASSQDLAFPASAVTNQDKIDWLTAEVDVAAQAVAAEAERPPVQQREAVYRGVLARGAELLRLAGTITGRLPRVEARVNETMGEAIVGLERIANAGLRIGMDTEQVRQIRGGPKRLTETTTAAGTRQQWDYGATVLSFDNGKLVEIRQSLKGEN
jgi:hypothetical protein